MSVLLRGINAKDMPELRLPGCKRKLFMLHHENNKTFVLCLLMMSFMTSLSACKNTTAVTDHYDGRHFRAPEPLPAKSFLTVLKWKITSKRQTWSNWVDYEGGPVPVERVAGATIKATFVNHSTFLLQTENLNIMTDPIWSERASPFSFIGPKRVHAPGVAFDNLPSIDAVLISHSHYDHLDIPTVKNLVAAHDPLFVVPLGVDKIIRKHAPKARIQNVDWGDRVRLNATLTVTSEPSQHWSARSLWDQNESLWTGYVLSGSAGPIYFAGDTGYASGRIFRDLGEKYKKFRLALLPIGAYQPRWFMAPSHINPDEAVKIFQDIHAEQAIAMHFGTFQLSDEAMDDPVRDLMAALAEANLSEDRFSVLKPGQSWQR
jgi:L-ascorbate metabolism protein UlaG (beta-lactamase superfamily)